MHDLFAFMFIMIFDSVLARNLSRGHVLCHMMSPQSHDEHSCYPGTWVKQQCCLRWKYQTKMFRNNIVLEAGTDVVIQFEHLSLNTVDTKCLIKGPVLHWPCLTWHVLMLWSRLPIGYWLVRLKLISFILKNCFNLTDLTRIYFSPKRRTTWSKSALGVKFLKPKNLKIAKISQTFSSFWMTHWGRVFSKHVLRIFKLER